MNSIDTVREFLGWCTVINIGLLTIVTIMLILMRDFIIKIHAKMFNISEDALSLLYIQYIAYYKIAIIVFNIVPYLALRIMT